MASDIWDEVPSEKASAINRDRMATYGSPTPNYVKLALFIEMVLGCPCSPQQAAMIILGLKVVREVESNFNPDYQDNLDDICGFANVVYRIKEDLREPAAE